MDENNGLALEALGLSSTDVVRLQNVQHCGAADTGEACNGAGGKSNSGQDSLLETGGSPEEVGHTAGRQPLEQNGEDEDKNGTQQEVGNGDTHHCGGSQNVI